MTTSPRPRPDLAPTSGATSPGDLAPRPPLLRRGAKSRGELDTPTNHHTTSPQGRSQDHPGRRRCTICAFVHRNGTGRAGDCTL
jgi:hypothetical protein